MHAGAGNEATLFSIFTCKNEGSEGGLFFPINLTAVIIRLRVRVELALLRTPPGGMSQWRYGSRNVGASVGVCYVPAYSGKF